MLKKKKVLTMQKYNDIRWNCNTLLVKPVRYMLTYFYFALTFNSYCFRLNLEHHCHLYSIIKIFHFTTRRCQVDIRHFDVYNNDVYVTSNESAGNSTVFLFALIYYVVYTLCFASLTGPRWIKNSDLQKSRALKSYKQK